MKRVFLLGTLIVLCASAIAVFANNSKEVSVVSEKYLLVMNRPDSVSVILIDPWVEEAPDWMDGYGEVLSKTTIKDKAFFKSADSLFSAPSSFEIKDVVKNCVHMPDAVIVFHSKKGDVKVSYSFYCDVLRFAQAEDYEEFDGDNIRLQYLELVKKAFPKDRYIRYLIKREKSNLK